MQSNGISAELLVAAVGGGQVNPATAAQQAVSMFSATNDATAVSVTPGSTSVAGNKTINKTSASSGGAGGMCDEKTVEYLRDLIAEKRTLETNNNNLTADPDNNSNATKSIVLRLLDQGKKKSSFCFYICWKTVFPTTIDLFI